jgi:carboxypeptidase D
MRLQSLLLGALALCASSSTALARQMSKSELHARQVEAAKRMHKPAFVERAELKTNSTSSGWQGKNITFSNPKASGQITPASI